MFQDRKSAGHDVDYIFYFFNVWGGGNINGHLGLIRVQNLIQGRRETI